MAQNNGHRGKRGGRPSGYTTALGIAICERIAAGQDIRHICKDPDMPSHDTVYRWLATYPEFSDAHARARVGWCYAKGEQLSDISARVLTGELQPAQAREAAHVLQWLIERMDPAKWGARIQVDATHTQETRVLLGTLPPHLAALVQPQAQPALPGSDAAGAPHDPAESPRRPNS